MTNNVKPLDIETLPTWIARTYNFKEVIILCKSVNDEMRIVTNDINHNVLERMLCCGIYSNLENALEEVDRIENE